MSGKSMIENDKNTNNYKFIDLFSGIGAFHHVLSKYDYECVFATEKDKYSISQYEKNYKFTPYCDIRHLEVSSVPGHDILCAGFSSQPFSVAGEKIGSNDIETDLFFEVEKIIGHHLPKVVVLENVKKLLTHNDGVAISTIVKRLELIGYTVNHSVLCAYDFGLPQNRERLFIVATLSKRKFTFPKPKLIECAINDIMQSDNETKNYVIANEKLIDLRWEERTFKNSTKRLKPRLIGKIKKGGQGDRIYSVDSIGIPLSAASGGTGGKTGLYYINKKVRTLAPRECARLQGFPDSYKIDVSNYQSIKQFAKTTPINILDAIFEELHMQNFL